MRILFIIEGLHRGGKERQLNEIVKGLSARNDITIGAITFNRNGYYSSSIKARVDYFAELTKRPTRLEPFFTIWRHIARFKPDIIHTWDLLSSLYVRLPATIYRIPLIDGSVRDAGTDKGAEYLLKRFLLKRSTGVIGNSQAGLRYYRVKGKVVYNAIDTGRFIPNRCFGECNLVMVANFTDYKDHATFIKASLSLLRKGIANRIFLAGDGPHRHRYQNDIENNHPDMANRFRFLGKVENVEQYLSQCRYGILCSTPQYSEGISNSILEYMAAGLIPIATNLGGTSEIIEDTVNGFLIKPGDSKHIADIIEMLESDNKKREKIVRAAKRTIETKFSYRQNIVALIDIYHSLCKKS